jgi:dolichyl-phosphate-mannose-protein mannosyltransferase
MTLSKIASNKEDLTYWQLVFASLAIFAVALSFRLWNLDTLPVPIFDEVFFPKFAVQYIDGNPIWEGHPPLGKYIIALGITIFGSNAIGDRIMEALFGSLIPVLLIGLVYLLTNRPSVSILAGLFLLLDGLFLVESRFSLLNVFLVALGLSSQIFLLVGLRQKGIWRTILLCLSGIMLGASPSVKWNGLGFLLVVVLLVGLVWIVAFLFPQNLKQLGILAEIRTLHWWQYPLCFIVIPALFYVGQWIPHLMMNSGGVPFFWESFWAMQRHIIWWHSSDKVVDSVVNALPIHPYCSSWFSWAVLARPIGYYFKSENNLFSDIHALGNPLLWWLSTASILGLSAWGFRRLKGVNAYLLIGYAANYLPWAIAKRCTFIYHYMSALVFSIIGLAVVTDLLLRQKHLGWRSLGVSIIVTVVISYLYFLPIWLGLPLPSSAFYQRMWFMPNGISGFNWI